MDYQQILPIESLKPYIRYFGVFKNEPTHCSSKTFKIIADGCPGLIFQENPASFLDQDKNKLPQLFLHGLTTKHSEKTTTEHFNNIGVYFQPNALKSVFGIDAHELTNQYIDLDLFVQSYLTEQLLETASIENRIAILTSFIIDQIRQNKHTEHTQTNDVIHQLLCPETPLTTLQHQFNISERSLERIFKRSVGISPKLFARISRFQASLHLLRQQNFKTFSDLAYDSFYSDQSHYIREFREFAGVSPKQFLLHAKEQAVNFPEWIP